MKSLVGAAMYTGVQPLELPGEKYVLESLPLIAAILVLVAVLALWPGLVLFLPDAVM